MPAEPLVSGLRTPLKTWLWGVKPPSKDQMIEMNAQHKHILKSAVTTLALAIVEQLWV